MSRFPMSDRRARIRRLSRSTRLASLSILSLLLPFESAGAGPFDEPGWSASNMVGWATAVESLVRGPRDLAAPELGLADFGEASNALGEPSGDPAHTVSLGDGGQATLHVASGIMNGPGDDFAVFENAFFDLFGLFAELAFVEVGSNGVDFARFEAQALNTLPVASFDTLDPSDYAGLAGRHAAPLGTGFDLADLASSPAVQSGDVDVNDILYVRIVDLVGDGSSLDPSGRPIFDPYPTPFETGGFDLDAVGVVHAPEQVPEPEPTLTLLAAIATLAGAGTRLGARRRRARRLLAATSLVLAAPPALALTATFEDLGLASESFENGSGLSGGFQSGGIFFENEYTAAFDSFSGFAASTTTDTTTPGFGNQSSNITGAGAGGSATFGIFFGSGHIVLPSPQTIVSAAFTNTTYAALSMRSGDPFAKQFGGDSGSDPDFFRLLIEGLDTAGASTGVVELMLADYRFADDSLDFILDTWLEVDLRSLGVVERIRFAFESSDIGPFGINTPQYFAIDDLHTVPEPGTALLLGVGLALLAAPHRNER